MNPSWRQIRSVFYSAHAIICMVDAAIFNISPPFAGTHLLGRPAINLDIDYSVSTETPYWVILHYYSDLTLFIARKRTIEATEIQRHLSKKTGSKSFGFGNDLQREISSIIYYILIELFFGFVTQYFSGLSDLSDVNGSRWWLLTRMLVCRHYYKILKNIKIGMCLKLCFTSNDST